MLCSARGVGWCKLVVSQFCCTFSRFEFVSELFLNFYIYSLPFHLRDKVCFTCTCWSGCYKKRAALQPSKFEWFEGINCADFSDNCISCCTQRSLACGICKRTVIGQQSSCCEPAPNSTDCEIINNPIVKQPCSLGATKSLKVMINKSSVFHCLTILQHYCKHSCFWLIHLLFLVAPAPTAFVVYIS